MWAKSVSLCLLKFKLQFFSLSVVLTLVLMFRLGLGTKPLGHVRKGPYSGWPGLVTRNTIGEGPEVPSKKGVSHLQMLKRQLKQRRFPSQLHRLTACFQAFVLGWVNCPLGADAHTDFTLMFSSRLGRELISLVSYYSFNAWQLFVPFRWMMRT